MSYWISVWWGYKFCRSRGWGRSLSWYMARFMAVHAPLRPQVELRDTWPKGPGPRSGDTFWTDSGAWQVTGPTTWGVWAKRFRDSEVDRFTWDDLKRVRWVP